MKNIYIIACLMATLPTAAQETYENANIATEELNGTARYVGMGGAMDALGAEISTISSNPAGIGLFRSSSASVSFGAVMQKDAPKFADGKSTYASFDQVGVVYSTRTGHSSFLNFAFNYHKSRNFDYILSASDRFSGASQNKLSYMKGFEGLFGLETNKDGEIIGNGNAFNQLDYLYYNALLADENGDYYYNESDSYRFDRSNTGYIGEYDFNISGNINDRVYLGLTLGVHDVHYNGYSEYTESFIGDNAGGVSVVDSRRITGSGFSVKGGVIWRPIEASPFRVGLSISTPTFYKLSTDNYTILYNNSRYGLYDNGRSNEVYDFKMSTPWNFGVSLGHTVGNKLALGLSYEYADYGSTDSRINDGDYYDVWYEDYYESSSSDRAMNRHTSETLKGVSTIKAGVEFKPVPEVAFRVGYNYVSPMYDKYGYKDGSLDSPGSYYASATDYTNWKATNRYTLGVGYTSKNFILDVAYQYSTQKGDFSPFMNYYAADVQDDNICNPVNVDNKRSQLLVTLGYRF